jgi:hypothetical protein
MGRTFRKERTSEDYTARKPKKMLLNVQQKKINKNHNFVDIEDDDYTFEEYDEPEQLPEDRSQ